MATRLRLGTVVLLALAPSACTVLDGLDGLTGGGAGDGGESSDGAPRDTAGPQPETGGPDGDAGGPSTDGEADARSEDATSMPDVITDVVNDPVSDPVAEESGALAYFQVVAMDMPLAYWRLDEPAGSTIAHDITGNGYNGGVSGGVTFGVPGAIVNDADTAATFDGATGFIDVGNSFAFSAMAPFSLEAWVKPTDVTNYHCWISRNDSSNGPSEGYLAFLDYSIPSYAFQRVDMGTKVTAGDTAVATANQWSHVVVTYAPGAGSTVYVNGQATGNTTMDVSLGTIMAHFVIGAENGGATAWWQGSIDEVAVYGDALSAARIQLHYHVGSGH